MLTYGALLEEDAADLYEHAPCGYFSATDEGLIVKANTTFLNMTGYAAAQLVGRIRLLDLLSIGSRILFAPELAIGTQLNERLTIEANWIHFSHGQLFGRQNPGVDNIGLRVNFRL